MAPSLISPLKSRRPGQGPYVAEMRRIGIEGDSGGIVSFEVTPEPQGRPPPEWSAAFYTGPPPARSGRPLFIQPGGQSGRPLLFLGDLFELVHSYLSRYTRDTRTCSFYLFSNFVILANCFGFKTFRPRYILTSTYR